MVISDIEYMVTYTTTQHTLIQSYKRTPNIFYASSKSENQLMYFLFLLINRGFAEALKVISFQNDVYVLHGRSPSKGTII